MAFSTKQLNHIDNESGLVGYPKSKYFVCGYRFGADKQLDLALTSFKRGADEKGCVPCMYFYIGHQHERGNYHLVIPWAIEGSIRGHIASIDILLDCYGKSKPALACALADFWFKTLIELKDTKSNKEKRKINEQRKELKNSEATRCNMCAKEDSKDVAFEKCGICKYYTYCGKKCQTRHWKEGQHMHECRLLMLLRKYCKPAYVKEIREAIIGGEDPKEIHTLQRLRMKLGLNRPKEEYGELLLHLDDNNNNNNNTMKRGTKVKVKGLLTASKHNGKFGIVTKVSILGEASSSSRSRVGVKLLDDSGTVLSIKIENLELSSAATNRLPNPRDSNSNSNRPNPLEYLIARKDGTVHIGSTPNNI